MSLLYGHRKKRVVIVTGVSGVGKSSLLNKVAKRVPIQVLSAGRLILDEINRRQNRTVSYDDLRTLDIAANQEALGAAFERVQDPNSDMTVLDAHVVVDTPNGVIPIDAAVFQKVRAALMVFLEIEPEKLFKNRQSDLLRNRPLRDIKTLGRQQIEAKASAKAIADKLGIPFIALQSASPDDLIKVLTPKECY